MINHRNWPTTLGYILAFASFVVAALYGVMYATGYRLNLGTGLVEKTGVLAVTSRPSGATVVISGKPYAKQTPIAIRNVLPQEYVVELKLDGYRDYVEKAIVKPGFATELNAIDLVLENPEQKTIEQKVSKVFAHNNNLLAWDQTSKGWYEIGENFTNSVEFERVPEHVRTALLGASNVEFAIRNPNNNMWVSALTATGRKWLAVAEPTGFRGALFPAPLNQATEDNIHFIDGDRMVVLVGQSLYTLDLNSSSLSVYAKNIVDFSWWGGQGYIFTKDLSGKLTVSHDEDLFDETPSTPLNVNIPVANKYRILSITPERWLLEVEVGSTKSLWSVNRQKDSTDAKNIFPEQVKVASNVSGVTLDVDKEKVVFASGGKVVEYDLVDKTEKVLKDFGKQVVNLIGRRNNSLFIQYPNSTGVLSLTGENYFEVIQSTPSIWLTDDSRRIWSLVDGALTEITLRKNSGGIFGAIFRATG